MKYKILTLISLFVLLFNGASAKESEAEYKIIKESWSLNSDGSQEFRSYKELTIFTHTAMNSTYGETFITYNPEYQSVEIHDSYTIQSDGTLIRTPDNAFVEVLPRNAQNSPAYNHLKELVVVHTGLDLGATIVLDYSIISRKGFASEIDVFKTIKTTSPIKNYTLTFSVPSGKELNYDIIGSNVTPKLTESNGVKELVWSFKNLGAASREPMVSVQNGDVEALVVTSYSSTVDALAHFAKQFSSSSDVEALAKEVVKGVDSADDKIIAIVSYIQTNIAQSSLTLAETNYTLRGVSDVIKSAYGTDAEKIALLNAMLNSVGVNSAPAVAYNLPFENMGVAPISELLVVADDYRLSYKSLNPVATNASQIVKISDGSLVEVMAVAPSIKYESKIAWSGDKPLATTVAQFSNNYLSYAKNSSTGLMNASSNVTSTQKENSLEVSAEQTVTLTPCGDYTMLYLPTTRKGVAQTTSYATYNSKRTSNLNLHGVIDEEYSYTVTLPDNLEPSISPVTKEVKNKVGSVKKSIKVDGKVIVVNYSINVNKTMITPSEYSAFRALIVEWNSLVTKPLLLQ
ncbi:MAG: DUF3857 domain-containing protein [Rikenellaceae bacterium]